MSITVVKTDLSKKQACNELIAYLAPHETRALFLLGNLISSDLPSFFYEARAGGKLLGVCGYYPTFKSCSFFTSSREASSELARCVTKLHEVGAVLGMKEMAMPFCDELVLQGKKLQNDPDQLFLELKMDEFKEQKPINGVVRPVLDSDKDEAVLLLRLLDGNQATGPITEIERAKFTASSERFCLEVDRKLVSIASSNGMAISAFQILGVVTDLGLRGRRFAGAVCSGLISHMQTQGAKRAVLFTGENNQSAIRCYLRLGFQVVGKYYMAFFKK